MLAAHCLDQAIDRIVSVVQSRIDLLIGVEDCFDCRVLDPQYVAYRIIQGCSTLSTVAPLEQGIEAAQSGGVSVLAEGADLVAAQNVVAEAAQPGEDARVVADA